MAHDKFDVVVIGAGPAGYVSSIRCSQLGFKTACIDKWSDNMGKHRPGGTCLNAGCIPSKALLESSEHYHSINNELNEHGIQIEKTSLNLKKMMQHKSDVVDKLTRGIGVLIKNNEITFYYGHGRLISENLIEIKDEKQTQTIEADNIILAPGSYPMDIPVAPIDNETIVDSSGALSFEEVPETLAIIGAGVIGLELGSVWNRLGSKVTLFEAQDQFLAMADKDIAKIAFQHFTKTGLKINIGSRVIETKITKKGKTKTVIVSYEQNGEKHSQTFTKLLVAVGRNPNTDNLFDPQVNLLSDENGRINVDDYCRTNIPHIYAIGDAVRGPMLAHKGSEEGMAVAETINGVDTQIDLTLIPSVIYTLPEIAWVGKTEAELHMQGIEYTTGIFPFAANGRAVAVRANLGQVKVLADARTDQILGVHIIGLNASELIAQAVIAMEFEATSEDLARTIFAHPTLSEAFHEAALSCSGRAIHKLNNR